MKIWKFRLDLLNKKDIRRLLKEAYVAENRKTLRRIGVILPLKKRVSAK